MRLGRTIVTVAVLLPAALLLVAAAPAVAQQVRLEAREAAKPLEPPHVVAPPLHYQTTRPPDADYYREIPRVEHNPAFIEPFAKPYTTSTSSGHVGLSGWTSPTPPVGPRPLWADSTGFLAFGISVTWGGPPPASGTPKRPPR